MDDLVYKRHRVNPPNELNTLSNQVNIEGSIDSSRPSLAQLQEKQRSELLEMAQVRYGIKGGKIEVLLPSLGILPSMTEAQIFKILLTSPEHERADQVLYALAKGELNAEMANQILAGLALLGKFKNIPIS
jgi:hypothetical protein